MEEEAMRRGERETSLGQILDIKGKELGNMLN